jgi:hypothetical protein
MSLVTDNWIIEAREGYATKGDIIELVDENNNPIDVTDLQFALTVQNWGREQSLTEANQRFIVQPFTAPATFPTKVLFKLLAADVATLPKGNTRFEVIIADNEDSIITILNGSIEKKSG